MRKPNLAQQLLMAIGVDHTVVMLGHHRDKSPSNTKKGPGRKHQQGKRKEAQK